MTRIRCTDCRNLDPSDADWCIEYEAHMPHPRHWRTCEHYAGPQPIAAIRAALADADLLRFVAELRDTTEGRALRLRHGIPERERFELYRVAGLKVLEPKRIHLPSKSASQQATPSAQCQHNAA